MTKEQYIDQYLDKYEQEHPDEKIDYEAIREQADCAWYDAQVERGAETEYDLSAEQDKIAKEAMKGMARAVNAYGKEVKRERRPNEDKREIIATVAENLAKIYGPKGEKAEAVEIANIERQINFLYRGVNYSITLTAHRPPKK